jgi:hypothetical protein
MESRFSYVLNRCLLIGMKYLSKFLCPIGLTEKNQVHRVGAKNHHCKPRIHDDHLKSKIETVRMLIFEKGERPNSKRISDLLEDGSWTPVRVSELTLAAI